MRTWIVSYADAGFLTAQRLLMESAARFGLDERRAWSREAIRQTWLYRLHREVLDSPKGSGYWLWKPFIISETLKEMQPGDLLIYADAGIEITADLSPLFRIVDQIDLLVFAGHYDDVGAPGPNVCSKWTKRDCFVALDCDEPRYYDARVTDASCLLLSRSDRAWAFVREWLLYCSQTQLLTDAPNVCGLPNLPGFIAHRWDQSILSLLAHRDRLELFRHPSQYGNHLKEEPYREPGEWTRHPYGSKGLYGNSPYRTLLRHHRGALGQTDVRATVHRRVSAPRGQVFRAWLRPDLLTRWSLDGFTVVEAESDMRAGGAYRVLLASDGKPHTELTGTYLEVQAPMRLVHTWQTRRLTNDPRLAQPRGLQQVCVTFSEAEEATVVDLTHGTFPTEKAREDQILIWRAFLDILAAAFHGCRTSASAS
jgi:uncharacterized protein YndB with AHSA1/START domain